MAQDTGKVESEFIYCASRLFAVQDRLAISQIAEVLAETLEEEHYGLRVFLPFRDTDQSQLTEANKSRIIFQQDIQKLDHSAIVVALVDGISKDDGVLMELGYSFARGVPYVLCTTDFVMPRIEKTSRDYVCEPIVDMHSSGIVARNLFEFLNGFPGKYHDAHLAALTSFALEVGSVTRDLIGNNKSKRPVTRMAPIDTVFCDIAGGKYQWAQDLQKLLAQESKVKMVFGDRWTQSCSAVACNDDIKKLLSARTAVFISDAAEVDSGTAFLHGIAAALEIPILLLYSGPISFCGPGGQSMIRNLMLTESAQLLVRSIERLLEEINN